MENLDIPCSVRFLEELTAGNEVFSKQELYTNSLNVYSNYHFSTSASEASTNVGSGFSECEYTSSSLFNTSDITVFCNSSEMTSNADPWLEILEQPCAMFRFRYLTENQGTPHGPVVGANSAKQKKTFPTVRLNNFRGEAIIRCWLFTVGDNPGPHVHSLVTKVGNKKIKEEPHDILVNSQNNYTASFENLIIIHAVKKKCHESYVKKKELHEAKGLTPFSRDISEMLHTNLQLEIKNMDMNVVALHFEALKVSDGTFQKLCHVVSRPIKNERNADLKIIRTDRQSGSCQGGDEIFIFVKKVTKDIKIRFFEEDGFGSIKWSAFAVFSPLDIHQLFAIAFRTPPYKNLYISDNVTVKYRLERTCDDSVSNSINFTYEPSQCRLPLKRLRTEMNEIPDSTTHFTSIDEFRNGDTFEKILFEYPYISEKCSLSEQINLPSILQTDGPCDELISGKVFSHDEIILEEKIQKKLLKNIILEGNQLIKKVLDTINSTSEKREDLIKYITGVLSEVTHCNNYSCFHWVVLLEQENNFNILLHIVQLYKVSKVLDIRNCSNQTALHLAVRSGQVMMVQKLLEIGANPNLLDSLNYTPFHLAALEHPNCLAPFLKDQFTNLELETIDGLNILQLATKNNCKDSLNLLIESKININSASRKSGDTSLHMACTNSFSEALEILLKAGADVNAQNYGGNTPLHIAVANGDDKCVEVLLKYKANPYIENFSPIGESTLFFDNEEFDCDSTNDSYGDSNGQTAFSLVSNRKILQILQKSKISLNKVNLKPT